MLKKKLISIGVLGVVILFLTVIVEVTFKWYLSRYVRTINTQVTQPVATNEAEINPEVIKNLLISEHGNGASTLDVQMSEIDGDYAKGVANEADGHGGGLWFAAKVNGSWVLVDDGNGVTTCDKLYKYPDFSKKLLPGCFDKTTNEIRMR